MKVTIHIQSEDKHAITAELAQGVHMALFAIGEEMSLTQALIFFPDAEINTDGPMPYFDNGKIVWK